MQTLNDLAGWSLHAYHWLPDDDFEIDFESNEHLSLDAWSATFKGAIAACVLGPWGDLKRSTVADAAGGLMDGVLNFGPHELNAYQQYTLWFDDTGAPGAIVIAESLELRSFKLKRGMDL